MSIHHTQAKQAAKLGGTLTESANNKGVYIATLGAQTYMGQSAKEALDKLIAAAVPAKAPRAEKAPRKRSAAYEEGQREAAADLEKEKAPKKSKKKAAKKRKSSDDEDDGEGDEEEGGKGSVVKAKYKKKYQPTHDTNGDEFTEAFRAATVNEDEAVDVNKLNHVARDNGLKITQWMHLKNKDGGVNVGMIRMNLGNVIRGMYRNGQDIVIGGVKFKGLPPKEKAPKKPRAKKAKA